MVSEGPTGQLGHGLGLFDRAGAKDHRSKQSSKIPSVESRSLSQNLLERLSGAIRDMKAPPPSSAAHLITICVSLFQSSERHDLLTGLSS